MTFFVSLVRTFFFDEAKMRHVTTNYLNVIQLPTELHKIIE